MTNEPNPLLDEYPELSRGYWIVKKPNGLLLTCKKCTKVWELKVIKGVSVGNRLFLLNHERSHDE